MAKRKPQTRNIQPRLEDSTLRLGLPAFVEDRIWAEVDYQAHRFNCSRSWVVSTMLADYLQIELDDKYRYNTANKLTGRRRKR